MSRKTPRPSSPLPLGPLLLLTALLALPATIFAHRLDECLQATLVFIEPGEVRLQINLTPGEEVAGQVLARIDTDRDGVISEGEEAAYAEALRRDLVLGIDGQRRPELKLTASAFPPPADLRAGWGIIQLEFTALLPVPLAPGAHRLTLDNRHLPAASVYLFNAARPATGAVQITAQKRNQNQASGEIEFTVQGPPTSPSSPGALRTIASAFGALMLVVVSAGMWRARKSSLRSVR